MARVQCDNRHFYDNKQYTKCPHCPVVPGARMQTTIAADRGANAAPPRTANNKGTEPSDARPGRASAPGAAGVTIGVFQKRQGIDPVVGWLVCTRGVNRGRDYRLHSGVNKIGRAPNMDVCIEGDETITRDIHCQIAYSSRNKGFTILPGTGARNLVYLNGEDVFSAMALQPSDLIEIGEGTFSFQPFCSDSFDWSDANESGDALGAS